MTDREINEILASHPEWRVRCIEINLKENKTKNRRLVIMYNYLEAVKEDVKEYIAENIDLSEFGDIEELKEKLNEDLWINDSVTGNASGSYTCNRAKAKKYVDDNKELVIEMAEEFGCKDQVMNWWYSNNYEAIDCSIRCYLLNQAISEITEEENLEYKIEELQEV